MAQIVSVQKTKKGIVVCLLLQPNETSPELRIFARARKRSVTGPPPASLATLQTDLSAALADPQRSSARGPESPAPSDDFRSVGLEPRLPQRLFPPELFLQLGEPDDFVSRARALLPRGPGGRAFSAGVGGISRALAGLLGLQEDTVSESLARSRNTTTQAVHFDIGVPGLGIPVLGGAIEGALRGDLLTALNNRDLRTLTRIRGTLESIPQVSGVGRKKRDMLDRVAKQFIERLEPD